MTTLERCSKAAAVCMLNFLHKTHARTLASTHTHTVNEVGGDPRVPLKKNSLICWHLSSGDQFIKPQFQCAPAMQ